MSFSGSACHQKAMQGVGTSSERPLEVLATLTGNAGEPSEITPPLGKVERTAPWQIFWMLVHRNDLGPPMEI